MSKKNRELIKSPYPIIETHAHLDYLKEDISLVIEKSSIGNMKIASDVKIDDLVQIGSDCNIKEHTQIAAGSIVGRDVDIGSNCVLGINTIVKPEIIISDDVTIGMGSVVVKDIIEPGIYFGNPLKKYK